MTELRKIEQHPCDREGCTSDATNHYHCGRCTSPAVTSMMGHYRSDGRGNEWYTCRPEDLPETSVKPPVVAHGVTPEPPAGSEQYREGWRTGYEQRELDLKRSGVTRKVVSTVEELESLPVHTVIVGIGDKWQNEHSDTVPTVFQRHDIERKSAWWRSPDYVEFMTSTQLVQLKFLPAFYVVVWQPASNEGDKG